VKPRQDAMRCAPLDAPLMRSAASNGTVFVTFTDVRLSAFALNWARQLDAVGLPSLVGTSEGLGAETVAGLERANARIFCADHVGLMAANGQAGRWGEAIVVLQVARQLSLSVLLSDADIAWIRDPLPYFAAAHAAHPQLDLLMMTDRAFNGYSSTPLAAQHSRRVLSAATPEARNPGMATGGGGGHGNDGRGASFRGGGRRSLSGRPNVRSAAGGFDLELEPGYESAISYNIGVIWFCAHALREHEAMLERWVVAVGGGSVGGGSVGGGSVGGGKSGGKSGGRSAGGARGAKLASWDQEPINKLVLQRGLTPDPRDRRLVRVDGGRLVMGVLPMLQFTTAFTYNMFRSRRAALGVASPYCLHAIFAHGHEPERKVAIFREEGLWHDPPSYYDPPGGRFLVAEPALPTALLSRGGFDLISSQLRQVHEAFHLAALLNRTLVLPRLRCGERPMAYPCYAWYHRAMAYYGPNGDKVAMPDVCPMYYWLDLARLRSVPVAVREPGFLDNARTPHAVRASSARLHLCSGAGASASPSCAAAGATADGHGEVRVHGAAGAAEMFGAVRPLAGVRVLRVRHLQWLAQPDAAARISTQRLDAATRGFWCTACPVTRRGAVIHVRPPQCPPPPQRPPRRRDARHAATPATVPVAPPGAPPGAPPVALPRTSRRARHAAALLRTARLARVGSRGTAQELNRSVVRELETFCKTEARSHLGLGPPSRSCCPRSHQSTCHECTAWERRRVNESSLPWTMAAWLPTFARLELPRSSAGGAWPQCTHPLCTGSNRARYP
jgi:hypothetical protein